MAGRVRLGGGCEVAQSLPCATACTPPLNSPPSLPPYQLPPHRPGRVIYGWDRRCERDAQGQAARGVGGGQPFYHVLPDEGDCARLFGSGEWVFVWGGWVGGV